MMIKMFKSGVGSGGPPTEYVSNTVVPRVITVVDKDGKLHSKILRDDNGKPIMKTRNPPPEIIHGDPRQTKTLIDSLDFKWKYTSGVIAFAPDDSPSNEDIQEIINDFERVAFAGLDQDRFDILWVKHTHEASTELHFVIPRVDLGTGKSFNPAPPGWEKFFDPLRDFWNLEKGWARPDDLARARLCQPGHVALQQTENLRAGLPGVDDPKKAITEYLTSKIETGIIGNRADIIDSLKELDLEITREGTDYVSVRLEPGSKPIRLRGIIYGKSFKPEDVFGTTQGKDGVGEEGTRRNDEDRAREARVRYEEGVRRRAEYNRHRYQEGCRCLGQGNPADAPGAGSALADSPDLPAVGGVEPLPGYLRRCLGTDAISDSGDSAPAGGIGGTGREGWQGRDPELRGRSEVPSLREDRRVGSTISGRIPGIGELLNSLENENDRIGKKVAGSFGKIIHAIRNGHEAARRSSQILSESSEFIERAIGTVGIIGEMSDGNQIKLK